MTPAVDRRSVSNNGPAVTDGHNQLKYENDRLKIALAQRYTFRLSILYSIFELQLKSGMMAVCGVPWYSGHTYLTVSITNRLY